VPAPLLLSQSVLALLLGRAGLPLGCLFGAQGNLCLVGLLGGIHLRQQALDLALALFEAHVLVDEHPAGTG
jgi:hypothetical protein